MHEPVSMIMNEHQLIQTCLQEIEKKLSWGHSDTWTNQEFSKLSNTIRDKTGISLSISSLRRLYGKSTGYKKVYKPQLETKNAISRLLGYRDWHDFQHIKLKKTRSHSKLMLWGSLIGLLLLGGLGFWFVRGGSTIFLPAHAPNIVLFSGTNLLSNVVPNTVVIHYHIPDYDAPLYIDWDDVPADRSTLPAKTLLETDSGSITHTYYSKDIYKIHLIDQQGHVIGKLKSAIFTNGWECYVIQNGLHLKIDSGFFLQDTVMHASDSYIQSKGIDFTKPYRLFYRNISNHQISGKVYQLTVDFKPEFRDNYVECAHFQAEIIGSQGGSLVTFMNTGCSGEIEAIYISDLILNWHSDDLSAFSISNRQWHSYTMEVAADSTHLLLDHNRIYSCASPASIGSIIGLRFEFLGNGQIRNLHIQ